MPIAIHLPETNQSLGKVITLNIEGTKDPKEMKFSLLAEDMISLEIEGTNMIFARKGK